MIKRERNKKQNVPRVYTGVYRKAQKMNTEKVKIEATIIWRDKQVEVNKEYEYEILQQETYDEHDPSYGVAPVYSIVRFVDYDMICGGHNIEEIKNGFIEGLEFCLKTYAQEKDEELTSEALKLKNKLLRDFGGEDEAV